MAEVAIPFWPGMESLGHQGPQHAHRELHELHLQNAARAPHAQLHAPDMEVDLIACTAFVEDNKADEAEENRQGAWEVAAAEAAAAKLRRVLLHDSTGERYEVAALRHD